MTGPLKYKHNLRAIASARLGTVLDREALGQLMDHFEKVMAESSTGQKNDLLHRLVKEVRVHGRHSVAEHEVWFRILHIAGDDGDGARGDGYREQTIEIALSPKRAIENRNPAP